MLWVIQPQDKNMVEVWKLVAAFVVVVFVRLLVKLVRIRMTKWMNQGERQKARNIQTRPKSDEDTGTSQASQKRVPIPTRTGKVVWM